MKENLKGYRDLKNSFDTAREEGMEQGREQGRTKSKKQIADIMIKNCEDDLKIALYTGLSISEIQELRKDIKQQTPS